MADKRIDELPVSSGLDNDALLVVYQNGETQSITGELVAEFAKDSVSEQVQTATDAAETAGSAADRAENATLHPPVIDTTTGRWNVWDTETGAYADTPYQALGRDFTILGYYDTLDALNAAVPSPTAGMAYGIGTAAPYNLYVWDAVNSVWKNNGPLASTGDMNKSVYDPTGKAQDIFAYVDSAVETAIGDALGGSY